MNTITCSDCGAQMPDDSYARIFGRCARHADEEKTTAERVDPRTARMCVSCSYLVTTDATCPLCSKPTKPHPEAKEESGYCQGCAEGPLKLESLHLVTWNEDPYVQIEDPENLYYLCVKCHAEQLKEQAE
jgi:hypothetical protein